VYARCILIMPFHHSHGPREMSVVVFGSAFIGYAVFMMNFGLVGEDVLFIYQFYSVLFACIVPPFAWRIDKRCKQGISWRVK